MNFLPHGNMHRAIWCWYLLVVIIQAVVSGICFYCLVAVPQVRSVLVPVLMERHAGSLEDGLSPMAFGLVSLTAGALVAGIVVLPWFYFKVRRWSGGLKSLHLAIQRLARGTKPNPLCMTGSAEIDYLAASFNDMAARMHASQNSLIETNLGLEQRILERTEHLARATQEAEQASRAKSTFLATMSHEIRTPLNGIIGALDLLRGYQLDDHQKQLIRVGRTSADSLLNIINNILDFSAIEAGQCELASKPFNLCDVLDEVLTIVAPLANKKGIELVSFIDHEVSPHQEGDSDRLRQTLLNFVNNAVKYTDHGHVIVRVQTTGDHSELRFSIHDTGIGIDAKSMRGLFTHFTQAGNDKAHTRGGTGLGLAISKQLVSMMGGGVGVESEVGKGSTFHFTVLNRPSGDSPPEPISAHGESRKVLVVEESDIVVNMIRHYLKPLSLMLTHVRNLDHAKVVLTDSSPGTIQRVIIGSGCLSEAIDLVHNSGVDVKNMIALIRAEDGVVSTQMNNLPKQVAVLYKPLLISDLHAQFSSGHDATHSAKADHARAEIKSFTSILIVEDNPINQFITKQMIESLGANVDVACSGEEAIQMVRQKPYDLVFMDYCMPDMNGLAVSRRIREMEAHGEISGRIPIYALTANAMQDDREACLCAGMDGFLSKPVGQHDLHEVILGQVGAARSIDAEGDMTQGAAVNHEPCPIGADQLKGDTHRGQDYDNLIDQASDHFTLFKGDLLGITEASGLDEVQALADSLACSAMQYGAVRVSALARKMASSDFAARQVVAGELLEAVDQCLAQMRGEKGILDHTDTT